MSRTDALKAIQRLIHMFGGRESWDEGTIATWAEQVAQLEDYEAACEATIRTVQTWTQPGRPPFAVWRSTYDTIRGRRVAQGQRAIGSAPYKACGPREYVMSLIERATGGDERAIDELGNWWRSGASRPFTTLEHMELLGVDTRPAKWPHPVAPGVRWN